MSERSLREYIALSLFFGLSMQKRAKGNIMLLLTNCEVHTGKYLDRSFELRTERSEVRRKS